MFSPIPKFLRVCLVEFCQLEKRAWAETEELPEWTASSSCTLSFVVVACPLLLHNTHKSNLVHSKSLEQSSHQ
jgi:hypothetical protein